MNKRILEIIAFPFHLIYLFLSFPFKVVKIILEDKKDKKINYSENNSKTYIDIELLQIGELLFPKKNLDFKAFFNSYLKNYNSFCTQNKELLTDYKSFPLNKLKAIEVIYIFGDNRELLLMTDWKGVENENEIEYFIENKLNIKPNWKYVKKLKHENIEEKQSDGKFIIDYLKAIDKDIEPLNKKLIFLNLDWDVYVYTVVDKKSYLTLKENFCMLFHGIEEQNK